MCIVRAFCIFPAETPRVPVPQRMINRTYFLSKRPCEVISCLSFLSLFVQERLFRSEIVPVLNVVGVSDKGRRDALIRPSLLSSQPRRRSENMNLNMLFFGQLSSSEEQNPANVPALRWTRMQVREETREQEKPPVRKRTPQLSHPASRLTFGP